MNLRSIARGLGPVAGGRTPGRERAGERGAVLALVAIGSVALLGVVGLGIDGSRMFEERRAAQGAVDHAAIAAAFASCGGALDLDAIAAGQAAATANGYTHNGTTVDVTIAVSLDGLGVPIPNEFTAIITSTISGTFSRVLGFTDFDVTVEATAGGDDCGAGGDGPGAIYAGGTCSVNGKYTVDVSGSSNKVFGGIHANEDVNVGGGSNLFTEIAPPDDPFTYVGTINPGAPNNIYQAGYPDQVSMPSPQWIGGWAPSDVTGGSGSPPTAGSLLRAYYDLADANGTSSSNDTLFTDKVTSITKDGVYYTTSTDGMDIGSVSGAVKNIVLVAPNGPIKISDSDTSFNAITDAQLDALPNIPVALNLPRAGVLMLSGMIKPSDKNCDEYTIAISGSNSTWNGVLWAPGGLLELSGSSNVAVNGALMGWAVRLNGSSQTIRYDATPFLSNPTVELLN